MKIGEFSHLEIFTEKTSERKLQLGGGGGLKNVVTSNTLTVAVVTIPSVIYAGLPNNCDVESIGKV